MLLKHPEHPGTNWERQKTKTRHSIVCTIHTKVRLHTKEHTNTMARISDLWSSLLPHSSPWTANRKMHLPKLQQLVVVEQAAPSSKPAVLSNTLISPLSKASINCITSGKGLIWLTPPFPSWHCPQQHPQDDGTEISNTASPHKLHFKPQQISALKGYEKAHELTDRAAEHFMLVYWWMLCCQIPAWRGLSTLQ